MYKHQTTSELGMAEHKRATKHIKKSQDSLAEMSLAEVRKSFRDDTAYQTHPKYLKIKRRRRRHRVLLGQGQGMHVDQLSWHQSSIHNTVKGVCIKLV
jgi:hypothetical protein